MVDWAKVPPPKTDWKNIPPPADAERPAELTAASAGLPPDRAAKAIDLSARTGLAPEYVAANLDDVQREHDLSEFSAELGARPILKSWADQSEAHAAVAKAAIGPLGRIEGWLSGMGDALKMGFVDIAQAEAARQYANGGDDTGLVGLERVQEDYDKTSHGYFEQVGRAVPQMAMYGATTVLGGGFGLGALLYAQNKGVLYRRIQLAELRRIEDDPKYEPLTDDERKMYATAGSVAAAVTLSGLLTPMVRALPGVRESLEGLGTGVLERAAATTVGQAAVRQLAAYGQHTLMGALGMALQNTFNSATVKKAVDGEVDVSDLARDAVDDFGHTLKIAATFSAWGPGADFLRERGQIHEAIAYEAKYRDLVEQANKSKTPAPQLEDVVSRMAPNESVHISHEAARTVADKIPDGALAAAEAAQDTVQVPVGKYLAEMRDDHAALSEDVKGSADGLTLREMREALSADEARALYGRIPADEQIGLDMPIGQDLRGGQLSALKKSFGETSDEGATAGARPSNSGKTKVAKPLHEYMADRFGGTKEQWAERLTPDLLKLLTTEEVPGGVSPEDHAARVIDAMPISAVRPEVFERLAQKAQRKLTEAAAEAVSGNAAGVRKPGESRSLEQLTKLAMTEQARDLNLAKAQRAKEVQTEMKNGLDRLAKQVSDQKLRAKLNFAGKPLLRLFDAIAEGTGASKTRRGWVEAHNAAVEGGAVPYSAEATAAADAAIRLSLDGTLDVLRDNALKVEFNEPPVRDFISRPRPFEELTPPQARNLLDAAKQLATTAKNAAEVRIADRKAGLSDIVEAARAETALKPDVQPVKYSSGNPAPFWTRLRAGLNDVNAKLLQFRTNVEDLGATVKAVLYDRMREQMFARDGLAKEAGDFYKANFGEMPKEIRKRAGEETDLSAFLPMGPGIAPLSAVPRTYLYLLHLNNGSHGNMERVLGGAPGWSQDAVNQVLYENPKTRLSRAELDFLQGMHDFNDLKLWPLARDKQERLHGIAPPKVSNVPRHVTFEDGTSADYRGGYWPLREDRTLAAPDAKEVGGVADFYGNKYQPAAVYNPATKTRTERAQYPVSFDWNVVPAHISQMVHDITMDEYVRDASKLLNHPDFKALAERKLGQGRYDELRAELRRVATKQTDSAAQDGGAIFKALQYVRSTAIMAVVGDSIPFALGQISHVAGMLGPGGKVSTTHGIPALVSVLKPVGFDADGMHFLPNWREYFDESKVLQERERTAGSRISEDVGKLTTRQGPLDMVRAQAGIFLHLVDRYLSTWAYAASKNEALAKKMSEADAVSYANAKVEEIMPTHRPETAAPILTNRQIGSLLMMHGFGSTLYQIGYRSVVRPVTDAWAAGDKGKAVGLAALRGAQHLAMLSVLSVSGQFLFGRGPEADEPVEGWMLKHSIAGWFYQLPWLGGAGQLAGDAVEKLVFPEMEGHKFQASPVGAPSMYLVQKAYELVGKLASDAKEPAEKVFAAAETVLAAMRLPSRPVRSAKYLYDLHEGDTYARGPFDVASGVAGYPQKGGPEAGPRDPFTTMQDLFGGK